MLVGGRNAVTDADGVRRIIGYLPENVQFYDNMTMRENLRYFGRLSGLADADERIGSVLSYLGFNGHESDRMGTFSKGMRQRVGIAQAILHEPSILFLDEPTGGLDPQGVRQLREIIVGLNRDLGMTIFMNTHLLSEVTRTCTSIGILRSGRIGLPRLARRDTQGVPTGALPRGDLPPDRVGEGFVSGFTATVQRELVGSSRERMAQALLIVFIGMVSVSSLIGWISNRTVTAVYEKVREAGMTTAENPFTHVSPLSYARNDVIYIVMIGAPAGDRAGA